MVTIGMLGGVASGKTFVAEQFRTLGAEVISADQIGHQVLDEPQVKEAIRVRWGDRVFTAEGKVDRRALSKIVFDDPPAGPRELAYLEQITHPLIGERVRQRVAELAARGDVKAVVIDAPLLLKAGWQDVCDKIIFVEASREKRRRRAEQRGWGKEEFAAREAAQESVDEKRKYADWVIDNSGSAEESFAQVQQFWQSLG